MYKWSKSVFKIIFTLFIINAIIYPVSSSKKKKVIIKVPAHIKHVYHHHLKTIHIQQPQTPKQHHVHHEHHDFHHDRDDFKGKRQGTGYGSWRGQENNNPKHPRDYLSYSASTLNEGRPLSPAILTEERPPPMPKASPSIIHEEHYEFDQNAGWRPVGDGPQEKDFYNRFNKDDTSFMSPFKGPSYTKNKGVVYEDTYGLVNSNEKNKNYDDIDLTYPYSQKNSNYRTDFSDPAARYHEDSVYTNYDHVDDTFNSDQFKTPFLTNYNYPKHNEFTENYDSNFGQKLLKSNLNTNKNVWNEIPTVETISPIHAWTETTSPLPIVNHRYQSPVWPDLKEHNSWYTKKYNTSGHTTTASSFIYHNIGGGSSDFTTNKVEGKARDTVAKAITPASPFQSTVEKPVSSYQVQVMHYTNNQQKRL